MKGAWQSVSFLAVALNATVSTTIQVISWASFLELLRIQTDLSCLISLKSNNDAKTIMSGFNPITINADAHVPICYDCVPTDSLIISLTSLVNPGPQDFYLNFWFTQARSTNGK